MRLLYDFEDKVVMETNTDGGRIESLTDNGRAILYPETRLSLEGQEKIRGGSHVCLPNFGLDTTFGLDIHGFGRDKRWDVVSKSPSYSTMVLMGEGDYERVRFLLSYEIGENNLRMNLVVRNEGDTNVPLAPGFHPYFPTKDRFVKIYGKEVGADELMATRFYDGDAIEFETKERKFRFETKNANRFAIWSDSDDYVCVEPTYNGPSFTDIVEKPYDLESGEEFKMDAILEWK